MNSKPKYLLIITTSEGTAFGRPEVINPEDFNLFQAAAFKESGGLGGARILAEIGEDYQVVSKTVSECDRKVCTYYHHYLVFYTPESGEQLVHEAFHAAESRCEIAQKRYIEFLENPDRQGRAVPEHLEKQAKYWENKICA